MGRIRTVLITLAMSVGFTAICSGYGQIVVETRENQTLYINSPSQILPSTQITFLLDPESFPDASPAKPVLIQIHITQVTKADREVLSQTLATGNTDTTSPLPSNGEVVFPLAVVPFRLQDDLWLPDPGAAPPLVGPDAVQLFRYVAGESEFWIRINESTAAWPTGLEGVRWGFTVALGGGVWPPNANSNWGAAGRYRQQSTLLVADLRHRSFSPIVDNYFFWVASVYQSGGLTPMQLYPVSFLAFSTTTFETLEAPATSVIGTDLTDVTVADLNQDGYDDVCSVDRYRRRLYWSFGTADDTFVDLDWLWLPEFEPVRLDVTDTDGDGRLDFFIVDSDGVVHIYDYWSVFGQKAQDTRMAWSAFSFKAAAVPGDTALHDLNGDGSSDYLVTDQANNTLNVYIGSDFGSQQVYPTGTQPVAMAVGDFNGDAEPDVATANRSGHSVSVFWNTGGGSLTSLDYAANGKAPVDIDTGDFDRDGRTDLVVAYADNSTKSISLWKAQTDGTFVPASAQKVFFQGNPSAVLAENIDAQNGADAIVGFANFHKLAVCVSDAAGALAYAYNLDTLADVVVDPISGVLLSEDSILSIAGGTAAGGISTREGAASIASQGYDVVHFPRSANISFSLVNLGTEPALANFELYDDSGAVKSFTTQSIDPRTQFPRYFGDLLGPETANTQRWVRTFLTHSDLTGIWLLNNGTNLTYLDGGKIQSITDARSEFVLPVVDVTGGHYTQLYLENPQQGQAHVTVRRHNAAGVQQASHTVLLNKRGRAILDLAGVFPGIADSDYLTVQSDLAIIGGEIFGDAETVS
ncbi:MAG TPA: VCBS repeat-containing protein, partial [Acidobacteriota bacterium]|nr:VCBS repeat-containing protein [Acidobacteriota bacterium]